MSPKNVNVLLVEDNPTDALLFHETLAKSSQVDFQIVHVETLAECLTKLRSKHADIVLVDLGLPDSTGLATLLKIHEQVGKVPIVVLTGFDDHSLAMQSLNSGAEDYILKGDFNVESLSRAMLYAIERKHYQSRIEIQLKIAKTLSESAPPEEVMSRTIEHICKWLNWDFGAFWLVDQEKQIIQCQSLLNMTGEDLDPFQKLTLESVFVKDEGLSGKVWAAGKAIFVPDLGRASFGRSREAAKGELCSAFAFPTVFNEKIFGVFEFFSHTIYSPNEELLCLFDGLGSQIGQFLARVAAEKSQAILATIIRSCDDAIITKTLDGIITSWNASAERLFGYSAREALGQPVSMIVPEHLREQLAKTTKLIASGHRVEHLETLRVRKNGELINVSVSISPVLDSTGKVIAASSVARDITERKLAELREDLIKRQIVQYAPIGIANLNTKLDIVQTNPKFLELCKVSPLSSNYPNLFTLLPLLPRGEVIAAIDKLKPFIVTKCNLNGREQASPQFCDITIWPTTANGEIIGAVLHVVDTTAAHQLQQQREDFIAAIAHDIKNPLVGAQRVFDMLCDPNSSIATNHGEILSSLRESNLNLLSLLQNLMDVYRYETLDFPCQYSDVELASLLDSCIKQIKSFAQTNEVAIHYERLPAVSIEADHTGLKRVIMNLLHNAIKFNKSGGTVHVSAKQINDKMQVCVTDTGCGITAEDQQKLFHRFAQGSAGHRYNGGTGLGLYLSKQIIEAHKGTIACKSNPDTGSSFTVTIPLHKPV